MDLVSVAHVHAPREGDVPVGETGILQAATDLGQDRREGSVGTAGGDRHQATVRDAFLVHHVGGHEAHGAVDRGGRRDHHLLDAELGREPAGMHRAGAAEGEQGVAPRIVSALDGGVADQVAHLGVDDAVDGAGRLGDAHAQGPGHLLRHRPARGVHVEGDLAAEEVLGVQVSQDQAGIGHRGFGAAAVVAHRTGVGAGAARADLQEAGPLLEPGDAAASRANGLHPDLGRQQPVAQEDGLVVPLHGAAADNADLEGGAPHVRRHDVVDAAQAAHVVAGGDPGRGTRLDGSHGLAHRVVDAQDAAVGLHDQRLPPQAPVPQQRAQLVQVGADPGADIGVEDRCRGALVLSLEGSRLAGKGHEQVGMPPSQQLADDPFMAVVGDGPQERDRHRLDAAFHELFDGALGFRLVQVHERIALEIHAFVDLGNEGLGNEGLRLREGGHVVCFGLRQPGHHAAAHHQDGVAEPGCGYETGARAGARDQRIIADGAGVVEEPRGAQQVALVGHAEVSRRVPHRVEHAHGEVLRRRGRLAQGHVPLAAHRDAIGEGAADVYAHHVSTSGINHN